MRCGSKSSLLNVGFPTNYPGWTGGCLCPNETITKGLTGLDGHYPQITQVGGGQRSKWSILADNYFKQKKRNTSSLELRRRRAQYMGLRGVSAIFRLAGSGNQEQRAEGEYLHVRDCQGWRHHVWRGEESPAHQGSLGITEEGPDYNNRCCRRQRSRYRFI